MLKKLRIKFVALNMATVAVVLVVVFTAICAINYQQSVSRVQSSLDVAISHAGDESKRALQQSPVELLAGQAPADGVLWEGTPPAGEELTPGATSPEEAASAQSQGAAPPEIGGKRDDNQVIPVAVFKVGEDGTLTAEPGLTTATLSQEVLAQAAEAAAQAGDGSGTFDALGLFYAKRVIDGQTYVAFADTSAASEWQSLALTLTGVGVAALAVFLVISIFFSRWALRPVAAAWEQQRRFVADASHDLKTPLTVILANTSILLKHPEQSVANQAQWIESTQTEAEHMQELVGDLLLLARLDEENAEGMRDAQASSERVDFSDLVEGELLQFESVAFERSIEVQNALASGLFVSGNTTRLRRLVTTLVDNACKYVDEHGCITVTLTSHAGEISLSVHNTGAPIADEDLPHVFDRFYRADKARTRETSGHGLGLAIARAIAEEHGGTLTATSTQAEGTTFTATLPQS